MLTKQWDTETQERRRFFTDREDMNWQSKKKNDQNQKKKERKNENKSVSEYEMSRGEHLS